MQESLRTVESLTKPTSPDQDLQTAQQELARHNTDAALAIWTKLRGDFPDHPAAYIRAASVLGSLSRNEEAESLLRVGRERFRDDAGFLIVGAWTAHHRGDFATAISRWEDLRREFPGHVAGYTGGAVSLRSARRFDEAEQILIAAADRFPNDPAIPIERASLAQHRRDWPQAISRWESVRLHFPDHQAGYTAGAVALREAGRAGEAEALLQVAIARFPGEPGPAIDHAWAAHHRGDFAEAIRRWDHVRTNFPNHHASCTGAAIALRSIGQFDEAERILVAANEKFPNEPTVAAEFAWLAHHRHDFPQAVSRWETVRQRFPNQQAGYVLGAVALRELREFDAADALLQAAIARFPSEQAPAIEYAWTASARRDWPEAVRRWGHVRESFPQIVGGYQRAASALREMGRHAEAEALLDEGIRFFPQDRDLLCDLGWVALAQRQDEEAARRFAKLREMHPDFAFSYIGEALSLRHQWRLREAEELLERGHAMAPNEPRILLHHAEIPVLPPPSERNYDEALRRLEVLRTKFPQFDEGYIVAIRFLRDAERLSDADTFGAAATQRLPNSAALAVEHAHTATARADWPEAMRRYADTRERFPQQPAGVIGLAGALSASGKHAEAEDVLREAMARFPTEKAAFAEFASIAERQSNWKEALARWNEASRRFPQAEELTRRIFEVRLRLVEDGLIDDEASVQEQPAAGGAVSDMEMHELVSQFESLGGTMLGCEFGLFQREYRAEPLGLLRWTDIGPEALARALTDRFAGVGAPENTRINTGDAEYTTADNRYGMVMHTFVQKKDVPADKMYAQSCRRLQFLRDKLVEDLGAAKKIFVYKITSRNLTQDEIDSIDSAIRAYGDTTWLYVRYADAEHPNGTVQAVKPGLMIGYIDRFGITKEGERSAAATASWAEICKRAYALWRQPASGTVAEFARSEKELTWSGDSLNGRDLAMQFESLGGTGHGCEFGIFQRSQGAEPLGLLRWADLGHDLLSQALEKRFDGVGLPENTNVFVPEGADEYWTTDKRYHMAMRSFIKVEEMTLDKVTKQMHRRLQFLRTKLIEDLEQGEKIFVYKNMFRNLTEDELARLHAAARSYSNNTLLYIRYEKPNRPNGTVEVVAPGLMIGYIDHFSFSPTEERLGDVTEGFLTVCQRAFQLWGQSRDQAAA